MPKEEKTTSEILLDIFTHIEREEISDLYPHLKQLSELREEQDREVRRYSRGESKLTENGFDNYIADTNNFIEEEAICIASLLERVELRRAFNRGGKK